MGIKDVSHARFRRPLMWAGLALITLLLFLSVVGAFLGSSRAENFFNSLPLTVYWLAFGLLLATALVVFPRLISAPPLLLMHFACILILVGSMWASQAGHEIQKQLFGIDKIRKGRMAIYEGHSENRVTLENGGLTKELPFSVELMDFQVEYYKPDYLHIQTRQTRQGQSWKIPVEIGGEFSLGPDFGQVTIVRAFENFKITIEGDKRVPIDDPRPGSNPALQVLIRHPDGSETTKYVFERFGGHVHPEDSFVLSYRRVVRDYISDLQIIKDNQPVARKKIEVNHPFHFGGYHFYQHSYDAEAGQYTILQVVSDTGLSLVYVGYLMLCIGVLWRFWLQPVFTRARKSA